MGISTVLSGFVMRHDRSPAFTQPLLKFASLLAIGALIVLFGTQFGFLQNWLTTTTLTKSQWGWVLLLALVMPVVVEVDKWIMRRRSPKPAELLSPAAAVAPAGAV
jgi:Ca2+-transporting ATPase